MSVRFIRRIAVMSVTAAGTICRRVPGYQHERCESRETHLEIRTQFLQLCYPEHDGPREAQAQDVPAGISAEPADEVLPDWLLL